MVISYSRIYDVVRQIPAGKVATYGQIAALAEYDRQARQVGYALSSLDEDSDVPWHRVINAKGEVSPRSHSGNDDFQRVLLEEEGIVFSSAGKIDLKSYRWFIDSI